MAVTCPKTDSATLHAELENLSRGPFRRVLAKLLENAPSASAISEQAEKHPDRWGQLTAIIARLGGYNEKLEVEGSLNLRIQGLSDSELLGLLAEYQRSLDIQTNTRAEQPIDNAEVSASKLSGHDR